MLITENTMREIAPAIFSETHSGTDRYQHIPTIDLIRSLGEQGYQPTAIMQHNPRKKVHEHATHLIRMRHVDYIGKRHGLDEVPEILLMNSHNRERAISLMAGIYRFACANGLITGTDYASLTVRHFGDAKEQVARFARDLPNKVEQVTEMFGRWKDTTLDESQALKFANDAGRLRFNLDADDNQDFSHLLKSRRGEDVGTDLYRLFNVVQENTVNGSRKIRQAKRLVDYNRKLWDLATVVEKELVIA